MSMANPLVRGALAPSALLAALLQATPASAQVFDSAGGGVFVGYSSAGVTWGFEAFGTISDDDNSGCQNRERKAFGPLARFALRGLSRPSLTATAFGGAETERGVLAFGGEAGVLLGFPNGLESDAALSLHTGLYGESIIAQLFTWQEWMLSEYPVGIGVRVFPSMGVPGYCAIGRPQRDAAGGRVESMATRSTALDGGQHALANDWQANAQMEYESVPAFLQLASELRALGAPEALVHRALAAAGDELVHTRVCSEVAEHFSGKSVELSVPRVQARPALRGAEGLCRLAVESWLDGCLGEGLAAELALDESQFHAEQCVRTAQQVITVDERRHADLAWDLVAWCLRVASDQAFVTIREALKSAIDQRMLPPVTQASNDGRRKVIAERHRDSARYRLEKLLAEASVGGALPAAG